MSLQSGAKLAHYEILEPIGKGGMAEVYRAKDPKLKRDVAIKVLPENFAEDAERMKRFACEAQLLASLNHPHIASIYELEDNALILELVEGPTLAERIAEGPLAPEEALRIAHQIAEALEYAHDNGIIHRDLKPANVKLTKEGDVKVLDFGLAKALGNDEAAGMDDSQSPTLTRAGTQAGVLLGTAGYMSPEQAKGKTVDRGGDIWAFGVVVFEMLTGQRLFSGETASETLASVIKDEPEWSRLPTATPSRIRTLLGRCLTRDPRERLQAIGEARIAIDRPEEDAVATLNPSQPWWRRAAPWGVAAAAAAALAIWAPWQPDPEPKRPIRLSAVIGADASLDFDQGPAAILSPDGSMCLRPRRDALRGAAQYALPRNGTLVYVPAGTVSGRSIDWMDRDGKRAPLRSARGLYRAPQFSPDGRRLVVTILDLDVDVWVYDWERDTMSRLTFAPENDVSPRWTPDGLRIVFGSWRDSAKPANLYWKRADGTGDVERLTKSETRQVPGSWHSWHPNGKLLAFTETKPGGGDILILPIEGDESSGLKPGQPTAFLHEPFSENHPSFSPDGRFLAYASYESGRFDVFVQSFPGPGGKWLISTDGGTWPTWSRNGEELFYRTADASRIMVATYAVEGGTFRAEKPRLWSEGRFTPTPGFRNFNLHPDGDRFAVLVVDDAGVEYKRDKVTFIFNFFEELERVAPSK